MGVVLIGLEDRKQLVVLALLTTALQLWPGWDAARSTGVALSELGVFYDGHMYLEIARSMPLPYAPEGVWYTSHAPGYPVLVWLLRPLVGLLGANWGMALLLGSWLPAILCPLVFYLVCKETGIDGFRPAVLFAVGNPRWVTTGATGHAESLAMLLVIGTLLFWLRGRLWLCLVLLSMAILTRFPAALVGIAIVFGEFVTRGNRSPRHLALLATPLFPFLLLIAYLQLRLPDYPGIFTAHSVFWNTHPTWPFREFYWGVVEGWLWVSPIAGLTIATLAFYVLAVFAGFRRGERALWLLPVWVAAVVFFHVSLRGAVGAFEFTRLAILAWPAALLIVWRWVGPRLHPAVPLAFCLLLAPVSEIVASWHARTAIESQSRAQPFIAPKLRTLDSDDPDWIDFPNRRKRVPRPPRRGAPFGQ